MSLFSALLDVLKNAFRRKRKEEEWASRFTNPPAKRDNKLPLDPDSNFS
jgi:hypothetical protein